MPLHTVRDWLGHTNIAQTSTYLSGTIKTQHDAMRQYEKRRATLQQFATDVATGGRNGLSTAEIKDKQPNESAGDRQPTVM